MSVAIQVASHNFFSIYVIKKVCLVFVLYCFTFLKLIISKNPFCRPKITRNDVSGRGRRLLCFFLVKLLGLPPTVQLLFYFRRKLLTDVLNHINKSHEMGCIIFKTVQTLLKSSFCHMSFFVPKVLLFSLKCLQPHLSHTLSNVDFHHWLPFWVFLNLDQLLEMYSHL